MWEGGGGVVMRGGVRCGTQGFIGQGGKGCGGAVMRGSQYLASVPRMLSVIILCSRCLIFGLLPGVRDVRCYSVVPYSVIVL